MPKQQEVEEDIHDVLARLRSGGRKGNASRSFTRAGDEQRRKDLRQERQDLVRGRGGRFRSRMAVQALAPELAYTNVKDWLQQKTRRNLTPI